MDSNNAQRRRSQPPGASLGSMFKNPDGDYAGRLIEAAGLKGTRIGGAQISKLHANFFVNDQQASATDIWKLIEVSRRTVLDKFGVNLDLEVEMLGDWPQG
jgi:UDP-N-acetylmuramate dehydrogenase